jgi:hypothetical protein
MTHVAFKSSDLARLVINYSLDEESFELKPKGGKMLSLEEFHCIVRVAPE